MVSILMHSFGERCMLLSSVCCVYALRKRFILCTVVYSFSIEAMLLGLWGFHSFIYSEDRLCAYLIDLMLMIVATGGNKKVSLSMLERSVKAPQAEQTGQDNTLA